MSIKAESFGRFPKVNHKIIDNLIWTSDNPDFSDKDLNYLAYGYGKSYGDSCLNPDNVLIKTQYLNRFINFDSKLGILTVESGVTLDQCIQFLMPRGWFLPVTPGTKFITVGGAIANDVHGKNHHKAGTFGCHVLSFELLRSDLTRIECSPSENAELFSATIGGLGLTGIITKAKFKCTPCNGPMIDSENIKFRSFEEFFEINAYSNDYEYTVAWINTNSDGAGIYTRGNFAIRENKRDFYEFNQKLIPFPIEIDLINPLSVLAFNTLYYSKQFEKKSRSIVHYNPFFYPLDAITGWNKVYGKNGFLQYQFVLPHEAGINALKKIFKMITESGNSSFLTVLKTFGDIASPGMMSFPKTGITMAIDFKINNSNIFRLLNRADEVLSSYGGILYPAKDARMSPSHFKEFFPNWQEFQKYTDPKFSSGFWKRVTGNPS